MSDHTLVDLMSDLELQTEVGHDKETLKKRREYKKREKLHDSEVKARRRKRKSIRLDETDEERRLRKYKEIPLE